MVVKAYGTPAGDAPLAPLNITRRMPGPQDVQIEFLFCGICHSDLHQARGEWAGTPYPCVPGHEIVGRVAAVGGRVTSHKRGDLVGVGCIVDSCQSCADCKDGLENYCDGMIGTYNVPTQDVPGHTLAISEIIPVWQGRNSQVPRNDRCRACPILWAAPTRMAELLRVWPHAKGPAAPSMRSAWLDRRSRTFVFAIRPLLPAG
ncbi:alcohol dehydrogenase catalytic domain-containing protein [Fertoebacter nigrum]|uniref:Alcohol dehydrogenase catalytic domain-containing protein n=1 Tax=Fertoeibacter niger TaxID=2656921 RepID=A0A8X8H542_9RHOB|nr:alcohol dehydrogenase catalytic domain-containing protein [Fertoeibacter niger]NUB46592.1 alcohol dehydrogenase catalytic domain-containing protein [Fertoeibacter niger]